LRKEQNTLSRLLPIAHSVVMAGYFSVITLIGGHLLVFKRWEPNTIGAVVTFVTCVSTILGVRRISLPSSIDHSIVASIVFLAVVGPMDVLGPYLSQGNLFFSSRYYFYLVNFLTLVAFSVFMYFQLWSPDKMHSVAAINADLAFWNGLLNGAILVYAAALFGTIYVQSISGFLGAEEMFLVMITLVGYFFLIVAPMLACIQERISRIDSLGSL
jgi:hypothetical protein